MTFKELNGVSIRQAFDDFDSANPDIYREFCAQAFAAIKAGKQKLSSKAIINYIRWNKFLLSTDDNFRINDAFTSMYARKFTSSFPQYVDLFEIRKLRTEEQGPYMIDENGQLRFL